MSTLRRLYYVWLKNGRTPEALALRFASGRVPQPRPADLRRFLRWLWLDKSISTMHGGHVAFVKGTPGTRHFRWSTMQKHLTPQQRKAARTLLFGRRQQRGIETRFRRFVAKGCRP